MTRRRAIKYHQIEATLFYMIVEFPQTHDFLETRCSIGKMGESFRIQEPLIQLGQRHFPAHIFFQCLARIDASQIEVFKYLTGFVAGDTGKHRVRVICTRIFRQQSTPA